jgi:hypothetical protein
MASSDWLDWAASVVVESRRRFEGVRGVFASMLRRFETAEESAATRAETQLLAFGGILVCKYGTVGGRNAVGVVDEVVAVALATVPVSFRT